MRYTLYLREVLSEDKIYSKEREALVYSKRRVAKLYTALGIATWEKFNTADKDEPDVKLVNINLPRSEYIKILKKDKTIVRNVTFKSQGESGARKYIVPNAWDVESINPPNPPVFAAFTKNAYVNWNKIQIVATAAMIEEKGE